MDQAKKDTEGSNGVIRICLGQCPEHRREDGKGGDKKNRIPDHVGQI